MTTQTDIRDEVQLIIAGCGGEYDVRGIVDALTTRYDLVGVAPALTVADIDPDMFWNVVMANTDA